jgi:diguanylate cyclase (GGDEF)-like protein
MKRPASTPRSSGRAVVRISTIVMVAGLTALAVFALSAQRGVVDKASAARTANRLAGVYEDARYWIGQNESLERKYRLEPSPSVLAEHGQAGRNLVTDLGRASALAGSASARRALTRLLVAHERYESDTLRMFAAVYSGNLELSRSIDHRFTDPVFAVLEPYVFAQAGAASREATAQDARLVGAESSAFDAGLISIVLAVGLVGAMSLVVRRYRRAGTILRANELARLSALVITDPLTGLRNHRAFHEDLQQELLRAATAGVPLALVLFDVDDLKSINDTHGHQLGDEQLRSLGAALTATQGTDERAYRIGGDEFAVILPSTGSWAGFQFAQRLQATLAQLGGVPLQATAGVSAARGACSKDEVIREADRALISAKRSGQAAAMFTPDMTPFESSSPLQVDEHHIRTLTNALALAVDAKDSYTQSHSQTVSNLCAAISTELGLTPEQVSRVRIAGLLHDVGKIGIPDAILRKPSKLTAEEFEQMKAHAVLGESIILAADMPERARWVRHHHERLDGLGYPDGLSHEEIPLESRIIHVADAFEAMISDRPYRTAPGQEFAIEELRRHAGTQFDEQVVEALMRVLGVLAPASTPVAHELVA